VAGAALLITVLTAASRLTGFVRTVVFAGTVGPTRLGDVYQTANAVPNVVYEIVAGGALAVAVVPVLAGPIARDDPRRVGELASALLTWTVLLLAPLAGLVALAAPAIVTAFTGDPAAAAVGASMLRVFALQIPLYGIGIVLSGVLNAHRRYAWPVLAPLLSSLMVIATCAAFAAVAGRAPQLDQVSPGAVLLLAGGTTAGVAVLALCLLIPLRSLGLRVRPRLRLETEPRRQLLRLTGATVVLVVAQELATVWLVRLANDGPAGSVVLLGLTQKVSLVPSALLALPLSTAIYPQLARAVATDDRPGFDAALARATRWILLGAGLGVAALIAGAPLLARTLVAVTAGSPAPAVLATAIAAFAPGLFGLALVALLSRGLTADGAAGRAAWCAVVGWSVAMVAALVAARWAPNGARVAALGVATTIGVNVVGLAMLWCVARRRGAAAVAGCSRTVLVSAAGAGLAGWLGWTIGAVMPVLGAVLGVVVFVGVVLVGDRDAVRG
jgi:putative peptidoglycan lipid II flippase